jgi:hypothetical protein
VSDWAVFVGGSVLVYLVGLPVLAPLTGGIGWAMGQSHGYSRGHGFALGVLWPFGWIYMLTRPGHDDLVFDESRYLPEGLRETVLERDGYGCAYCGSAEDLYVDHIVPISRGGFTEAQNLQPLCAACREQKGELDDAHAAVRATGAQRYDEVETQLDPFGWHRAGIEAPEAIRRH